MESETPRVSEEEIRLRILHEREVLDAERQREKQLEEESAQLDREIEQEIRGVSILPPAPNTRGPD